jgi:hypothetical protein
MSLCRASFRPAPSRSSSPTSRARRGSCTSSERRPTERRARRRPNDRTAPRQQRQAPKVRGPVQVRQPALDALKPVRIDRRPLAHLANHHPELGLRYPPTRPRSRRPVLAWKPGDSRSRRPAPSGPGTERSTGVPSGVVSLPRLGSGDDEVRKYGAVIAIIAAIGTLIVVFMVWGSNGSDAKGSTCTEVPAGRVPPAIICPGNATPENSKRARLYSGFDLQERHVLDLLRLTLASGRADQVSDAPSRSRTQPRRRQAAGPGR